MFLKSTEYSLRVIVFLALNGDKDRLWGANDIANELDFPAAYTGKVLQNIARKNLIISVKGPGGGFYVDKATYNLTLLDIVERMEGLEFLNKCGIGLHNCNEDNPCPVHDDYKQIKGSIRNALSNKTIVTIKHDIIGGKYSLQFALY